MELQEAIRDRRSIRKYTDQEVTAEQIDAILQAAYWAPRVAERWIYIVVRDDETKKVLGLIDPSSDKVQDHVVEAQVDIVVCIDLRGAEGRHRDLYPMQEASAAIQNMLLTAHELGLGTCWNGSFDDEKVKQVMGVPEDVIPVAIISLGYPAEPGKGLRRKTLEQIVHREKF